MTFNLSTELLTYIVSPSRVCHLAIGRGYREFLLETATGNQVPLSPAILHTAAAESFADILRHRLRSLLCVVHFRNPTRGMGDFPLARWCTHFAQTFPLRPRGLSTSPFHWLQADPRPGVELDLRQLAVTDDPEGILQGWRHLEQSFGLTPSQQAARESDPRAFRLYICPSQKWPGWALQYADGTPRADAAPRRAEEVWSRDELAQHLEQEAEHWVSQRWYPTRNFGGIYPMPKYSAASQEEADMFEAMEKLPCTAVGMWLFLAKDFPEPVNPQLGLFDISAVRPGLLLFEV